jgi:hypothetical protein
MSGTNGEIGALSPFVANRLAIDASGNVWVPLDDEIVEFVGVASPTKMPAYLNAGPPPAS